MKAERTLIVNRSGDDLYVTYYEMGGEPRVDLTLTPDGTKTGVLAKSVIADWEKEGYVSNIQLEDVSNTQILPFYKPDADPKHKFLKTYNALPEPPPKAEPIEVNQEVLSEIRANLDKSW